MGVIEPTNLSVKSLRGLHLYHCGRSLCAGRPRFLLAEKKLGWVSHHIDLYDKKDNITPEYFGINPKGVVPTLVHDGVVVVESNDILLYLEEHFPTPSLMPEDPALQAEIVRWLKKSNVTHVPGVKTFAYATRVAALVIKTPEQVERYWELQKDKQYLDFHAKHDLPGAQFSKEDIDGAMTFLHGLLGELEASIGERGWLVGDSYSLADMSWGPTAITLERLDFPLDDYPNVRAWYPKVRDREAYRQSYIWWETNTIEGVTEVSGETQLAVV